MKQAGLLLLLVIELMSFVLGRRLSRSRSKKRRYEGHGYITWAFALWVFAIPEFYGFLAGPTGRIPILSKTVGNILDAHDYLSVVVVAILVFALVHLVRIQIPAHRRHASAPEDERIEGRWAMSADIAGRATPTAERASIR